MPVVNRATDCAHLVVRGNLAIDPAAPVMSKADVTEVICLANPAQKKGGATEAAPPKWVTRLRVTSGRKQDTGEPAP